MTQLLNKIIIGASGVKNKPFRVKKGGYLILSTGAKMYIPTGYCFDNASIPKITKWIYDTFRIEFFNYKYIAFLVHDFLYNFRGYQTSSRFKITPITRLGADNEMEYFMKEHGDTNYKVFVWRLAVRTFGMLFFGKM